MALEVEVVRHFVAQEVLERVALEMEAMVPLVVELAMKVIAISEEMDTVEVVVPPEQLLAAMALLTKVELVEVVTILVVEVVLVTEHLAMEQLQRLEETVLTVLLILLVMVINLVALEEEEEEVLMEMPI